MTTFEFKITKIGKISEPVQGLSDVCAFIEWRCVAIKNGAWVARDGKTVLPPPVSTEFIPFNEITEATATAWVASREDLSQVETELSELLSAKLQPPIIETAPPWLS